VLSEYILFSPVTFLAERIRLRDISPIELTEAYLQRLERIGPKLNAVVTVTRELATREAREAEREIRGGRYRGPLHGIPYGAKDLLATRGIPTTWGAPPLRDQTFDFDATTIQRLRQAGAILIGKLAMMEMAGVGHYRYASASITGAPLNPWDPQRYTGGSSSGSGSTVTAGLAGFSIGSETWGSILTPASFCGITGLRPTFGRASRHGAMSLAWSMDKLGPMCRSVEDCAIVLAAISGADPADEGTLPEPFEIERWAEDLRGVRIGIVREDYRRHGEPEVEKGFRAALEILKTLGADLVPVDLPAFPYDAVAETIVASEAAAYFEGLIADGRIRRLADLAQQAGILAGQEIRAVDYLKAMRLRRRLRDNFSGLWGKFAVLVGPASLTVAPRVTEEVHDLYITQLVVAGNLLGLPGISVPCGFGKHSLPIALSVVGPPLKDFRVLQVARCYQDATDWHLRRPPEL